MSGGFRQGRRVFRADVFKMVKAEGKIGDGYKLLQRTIAYNRLGARMIGPSFMMKAFKMDTC